MHWLARVSRTRALVIAALWPVMLLAIPVVLARLIPLWVARNGDEAAVHVTLSIAPGAWPGLAALLLIPPLGFLVAWRVARR